VAILIISERPGSPSQGVLVAFCFDTALSEHRSPFGENKLSNAAQVRVGNKRTGDQGPQSEVPGSAGCEKRRQSLRSEEKEPG
jgi:hypothetical protein